LTGDIYGHNININLTEIIKLNHLKNTKTTLNPKKRNEIEPTEQIRN